MVSPLEKELQGVTKIKPKASEKQGDKRQDYLRRVLDVVAAFQDDKWNELTEPAQKWVNDATRADNDKQELPDFEEAEVTEAEAKPSDDDTEEEAEVVPAKKVKAKGKGNGKIKVKPIATSKEKVAAAAKVVKGTKDKQPRTLSEDGIKYKIKRAILKKPSISANDLFEMMGGKGNASRSTIAAVRAEFRHSLQVIMKDGLMKELQL